MCNDLYPGAQSLDTQPHWIPPHTRLVVALLGPALTKAAQIQAGEPDPDPAQWRFDIPQACIRCRVLGRYSVLTRLEDVVKTAFDLLLDNGLSIPEAAEILRLECDLNAYELDPGFWAWLNR